MTQSANDSRRTEKFDEAIRLFDSLPLAIDKEMAEYQGVTLLGSTASKEAAEFPGDEGIQTAYSLAVMAIHGAADHMFAMERVLTSPVMTFSPWTIARTILEQTAFACWLLRFNVSSQTRMACGMNVRLQSLIDERRYIRDTRHHGPDQESLGHQIDEHVDSRIGQLREDARARNIPEKLDRNNRLIGFAEGLPKTVQLVDLAFNEADVYRLLSGLVHGRQWATMALPFKNVRGAGIISPEFTIEHALFLLTSCVHWYCKPIWNLFSLQGWDLNNLAAILEGEYDKGFFKAEARFWRRDGNPNDVSSLV